MKLLQLRASESLSNDLLKIPYNIPAELPDNLEPIYDSEVRESIVSIQKLREAIISGNYGNYVSKSTKTAVRSKDGVAFVTLKDNKLKSLDIVLLKLNNGIKITVQLLKSA